MVLELQLMDHENHHDGVIWSAGFRITMIVQPLTILREALNGPDTRQLIKTLLYGPQPSRDENKKLCVQAVCSENCITTLRLMNSTLLQQAAPKHCIGVLTVRWTTATSMGNSTCSHPMSSHTKILSCAPPILSRRRSNPLALPVDVLSLS